MNGTSWVILYQKSLISEVENPMFGTVIELWNVTTSFYNDYNNERFLSSRVITKTLLLDQSWTWSFLIRYKRWKQNIYDIQRRVKKQT